ncbi:M24 family metallopeptidase [Candidatus Woesearchaeota archaeon]|jgi:Xaa-Pro aminopeptidase|nr:M24 family metallopeptidase [Candidatus Woesearchaeota archaeon]MBT5343179.1 M24 family metallopeptidase [Candidatus Woesearchaeota archaeon]
MKLKAFQSYLRKEKIGLAILTDQDVNITYFTKVKPSFSYLFISPRSANLYLTKLDKKPKFKEITVKILDKDWKNKLNKNVKKIGLNYSSITMAYSKKLKKLFPKAKFVDISKQLMELRSTKTNEERKCITKACQITDFAFQELIKELPKKRLKTEQEVADFLERKIKSRGGELAFPTIVAMGKNAAVPHHLTSQQILKRGFLLLDFGAKYDYYCADMSRVLFLGTPNKEEIKMYNLLLEAQKGAIKQIEENKSFIELDKFARKQLGKYSSYFIHSLGHGLGLDIHEKPSYLKESNYKIKYGQAFTVEPGIYFPGKFGLRIEDTVIFDGKVNVLTKSNKELIKVKI